MLEVCVKQLVAAAKEAAPFTLPKMDGGTSYLYHRVYGPLSMGIDVPILGLDFGAFEVDDIDALNDLYNKILAKSELEAMGIVSALRNISPIAKATAYI
jgi:hypothetical protein